MSKDFDNFTVDDARLILESLEDFARSPVWDFVSRYALLKESEAIESLAKFAPSSVTGIQNEHAKLREYRRVQGVLKEAYEYAKLLQESAKQRTKEPKTDRTKQAREAVKALQDSDI